MKKLSFTLTLLMSLLIINFTSMANEVKIADDNIGDTAAIKKYNNLTLNSITYNKKFSLNFKKETPKQYLNNYNTFDIRSKKPAYIQSVLMRKGNSIQAIPLYTYTLPF